MKLSSLSILFSEEANIKGDVYIVHSPMGIDESSPSTLII